VARYGFGKTPPGVIYEQLKYEQQNSVAARHRVPDYSRNAYAFTATHESVLAPSRPIRQGPERKLQPGRWRRVPRQRLERGILARLQLLFSRRGPICTGFTLASPMIPTQPTVRERAGIGAAAARRTSAICLACGTRSCIAKSPLSGAVVSALFFALDAYLRRRKPVRMFSFRSVEIGNRPKGHASIDPMQNVVSRASTCSASAAAAGSPIWPDKKD